MSDFVLQNSLFLFIVWLFWFWFWLVLDSFLIVFGIIIILVFFRAYRHGKVGNMILDRFDIILHLIDLVDSICHIADIVIHSGFMRTNFQKLEHDLVESCCVLGILNWGNSNVAEVLCVADVLCESKVLCLRFLEDD